MASNGGEVGAAERRQRAAELRAAGLSYRRIAAGLKVSLVQAHRDVRKVLRSLHEDAKETLAERTALERERLELPVAQLAALIEGKDTPAGDRLRAIEVWRKLSESRRKLDGLDSPERHQVSGEVTTRRYIGVNIEDV